MSKDSVKYLTPVILAGGMGTRLSSVLPDLPKVLAPVAGRPFISYILDQLAASDFRKVILCTGYKGDIVRKALGARYKTLEIQYSQEREPLGTGGAMRYALPMIDSKNVLTMNGDSYIDADLSGFIGWYLKNEHDASLVLTKVTDTSRYGRVKLDTNSRVTDFKEKQAGLGPGWINAGVYLFKTSLLELIPVEKMVSLEYEFFPNMVGKGLYGYHCENKLLDIGTPGSFASAERFFQKRILGF